MNLTPIKQKLLRTLTRSHATFRDLSARNWTVHAAERQAAPPAFYPDHDLDKVTAVMEDTSWEQEMARIRGGEVEHAATTAYELTDCEILDGSLYKGALRMPLSKQPPAWLPGDLEETIESASLSR